MNCAHKSNINIEIFADIEEEGTKSVSVWVANSWNTMGIIKAVKVQAGVSERAIVQMPEWKDASNAVVKHYLVCKSMREKFYYVSSSLSADKKKQLDLIVRRKENDKPHRFGIDLSSQDVFATLHFQVQKWSAELMDAFTPLTFNEFKDFKEYLATI